MRDDHEQRVGSFQKATNVRSIFANERPVEQAAGRPNRAAR